MVFHGIGAGSGEHPWLPIVTQVIDLLSVLPVLYFTEGRTPRFPFFVVFTLNAGIRWGGWSAWSVSIYSVLVYGWLLLEKMPAELDLNNDLMRLGYSSSSAPSAATWPSIVGGERRSSGP